MSKEATIEAKALALRDHLLSQPQHPYTNNPWAVVDAIEAFASGKAMMTFKRPKLALAQQALAQQQPAPKTILEFGTYVGSSAIAWGAILRELHDADALRDCRVYTFELSPVTAGVARDLVRLAGLAEIVRVVEGPAAESLRRLFAAGEIAKGGVDMVFFDHWEEFYLPDLRLCEDLGLFRLGSLAIADNTDRPGAPAYLEYVRAGGREVRYETRSLEAQVDGNQPKIVEVSTVVGLPV
ncbi:S-adenosyl-L-methionine-dependent methyltransferase [Aspergillus ambiguus]|uniref:putative O-methyltransferase n=1 Tax=Aspergillus ambiguus TaxID=176160 RepID=UPI003CCD239E